MFTTNLKSLIESALPVSPDRRHSLGWSWGGTIGIFNAEDGDPLLTFREEHGAILRAGFSPDMHELLAENEDGSFSIWHTESKIGGEKCAATDNIVEFMLKNELVPCLNIKPGLKACRFELTTHDFSEAQYNCYNWGNYYCAVCSWHRPARDPGRGTPETRCALRTGCEFKRKGLQQ